jgi:alpha-glucosidase
MKQYTRGPDRLHSAYGFQYLYADKLTASLVRECSERWPDQVGEGWPSWAFSNHDAPRVVSRWSNNRDEVAFAKLALLLLLTLRGSVFLYQGEELGLPQGDVPLEALRDPEAIANWPHTLGRDGARTPIPWMAEAANAGFSSVAPWLPVDPAHRTLAVDVQERDAGSTLQFARRAIALRQRLPALRTGGIRMLDAPEPVLAFVRGDGGDALLCVFNLGARAVAWRPEGDWDVIEAFNAPQELSDELPGLASIVARRR